MTQISIIRVSIFRLGQVAFAEIAGVTQPTVSRWERGDSSPTLEEMLRIRQYARDNGILWNDAWFFEEPVQLDVSIRKNRTVRVSKNEQPKVALA